VTWGVRRKRGTKTENRLPYREEWRGKRRVGSRGDKRDWLHLYSRGKYGATSTAKERVGFSGGGGKGSPGSDSSRRLRELFPVSLTKGLKRFSEDS